MQDLGVTRKITIVVTGPLIPVSGIITAFNETFEGSAFAVVVVVVMACLLIMWFSVPQQNRFPDPSD